MEIQKPYFSIFAFPGVTGPLHLGHMRGALFAEIKGLFKKNFENKPFFFPAGLHATGKGSSLFYKNFLINGVPEYNLPPKKLSFNSFLKKIKKEYFRDWKLLGLELCQDSSFITTDKEYSTFVLWTISLLQKKKLIKKKSYFFPYCDLCGPVSVDVSETDLKKGGDAKKVYYKIYSSLFRTSKIFFLDYPFLNLFDQSFEIYRGCVYSSQILRNKNKKGKEIVLTEKEKKDLLLECTFLFKDKPLKEWKLSDKKPSSSNCIGFSKEVLCRCSSKVYLRYLRNQEVIEYSSEEWKKEVLSKSSKLKLFPSEFSTELKTILQKAEDRPLTRIGSWVGTKYKRSKKIEAISDSTLYPFFYIIKKVFTDFELHLQLDFELLDYFFFDVPTKKYPLEVKKLKDRFLSYVPLDINIVGKEHKYVHIPAFLFFNALLPDVFFPKEVLIHWYLVSKQAKISKSKGNMPLNYRHLIKKYSTEVIRLFLLENVSYKTDLDFTESALERCTKEIKKIKGFIKDLKKETLGEKDMPLEAPWRIKKLFWSLQKILKYIEENNFELAILSIIFSVPALWKKLSTEEKELKICRYFRTFFFKCVSLLFKLKKLPFLEETFEKKGIESLKKQVETFEEQNFFYLDLKKKFRELYTLLKKKATFTKAQLLLKEEVFKTFEQTLLFLKEECLTQFKTLKSFEIIKDINIVGLCFI